MNVERDKIKMRKQVVIQLGLLIPLLRSHSQGTWHYLGSPGQPSLKHTQKHMALNKLELLSLPNQSITKKKANGESLSYRRLAKRPLDIRRTTNEVYFLAKIIIHRIRIHPDNLYKYQTFLSAKVSLLISLSKTLPHFTLNYFFRHILT